MLIHWFNPENDLALAVGSPTYTPKRAALQLQKAAAVLPLWYAAGDDQVLCYGVNAQWLKKIRCDFGITTKLFDHQPQAGQIPDPWGWSAYTKRQMQYEGFVDNVLPSDETISRLRQLSHRRTAARVAAALKQALPNIALAQPAYEATSIDDVCRWLSDHPEAYIKQPWSSSGRGVLNVNAISREAMLKMADDSLRRQGSVMLEVAYRRAIDFARLYSCRDGRCYDIGTSVFTVDNRGGYTGNLLASEERRVAEVAKHYPIEQLRLVTEALRKVLEREIAPYYDGILGVDMLVDTSGLLDAVVEINLRKTMGYVANCFAERFMDPDAEGEFKVMRTVDYTPNDNGYETADHKLTSGTLQLTPPNPDFTITAKITSI